MTRYLRAWVIGGDDRYTWAVKSLRDSGLNVKTWGVPGEENQTEHLVEALTGANLVLLPMKPFVKDALTVGKETVEAGLLPRILGEKATLVAGAFPEELEAWLQNQGVKCVSFLELESYLLRNAAVTAEGGVYLALHHMERTVFGSRALVIGGGRIGRFLAEKLRALGAEVTVSLRKTAQKAELELAGFQTEHTGRYDNGLAQYDLVINTVPKQIMNMEQFGMLSPDCVVIELASLPGGFPEEVQHRIVMGQALPGKTAPKTAGENLTSAVFSCLSGEGRTLE